MQSADRYETCKSDVHYMLKSTLNKVRDTMSRQGMYLLPRQLEEYNRVFSRLGLVLIPSGEVIDYASDMYKDEGEG